VNGGGIEEVAGGGVDSFFFLFQVHMAAVCTSTTFVGGRHRMQVSI